MSSQNYQSDRNLFLALALFVIGLLIAIAGGVSYPSGWVVGIIMILFGVVLCYFGIKIMRDNQKKPGRAQ
jgi:threonine/homoserine/homoserine lactone efflux protein